MQIADSILLLKQHNSVYEWMGKVRIVWKIQGISAQQSTKYFPHILYTYEVLLSFSGMRQQPAFDRLEIDKVA